MRKKTLKLALVPGLGYPNPYREFVEIFPDDNACATFLTTLRWPERFICPACKKSSTPWNESRRRLACTICRHQTSVTAGTIFDKTRKPPTTWFEAAWHLTTAKSGMSAKTLLERTLGTSYRVAWTMLQRFRVDAERKRLSGDVEVGEALVGGVKQGSKRGRGTTKSIVAIALEIKQPKGFGRVRMRHIQYTSGSSLLSFVRDVVATGAVVHTNGWRGYSKLPEHGYKRKITVLSSSGDPAHVSMPGVHRVSSLLKRWILGTHQGSLVPGHLQSYLEFRFNRRTSRSRGLVFRRLLEQAVVTGPIVENDGIYGYNWGHS